MEDIHLFILLFLAIVFLCRSTKEGFEDTGPGGVVLNKEGEGQGEEMVKDEGGGGEMVEGEELGDGGEGSESVEEEVEEVEESPQPVMTPPGPAPPMDSNISVMDGYDSRKIFSSPSAPNFGSLLELKQVENLNKMYSKKDISANIPPVPQDTQMPSLSEGASVPNKLEVEGGGNIELHMVYADWCGHSQNALKPFKALVEKKDVKTSSGKTVKFVLTEESSDGFKDFKGKVKGFPSYMVKDGDKLEEIDVGDRSEQAIINAVKNL